MLCRRGKVHLFSPVDLIGKHIERLFIEGVSMLVEDLQVPCIPVPLLFGNKEETDSSFNAGSPVAICV